MLSVRENPSVTIGSGRVPEGGVFTSLRARYYIVVVGIATIPILLLGLFAGLRSANELERQSLILQAELAVRVEREISLFISARLGELRVLERTNVLSDMNDRELSASLGRLLAHDQVFQELVVMDTSGNTRVFVSRTDISTRNGQHVPILPNIEPDYWSKSDTHVGQIKYDAELREPLLDVVVPILKRQTGEVVNVLLAHVRFRPIWDLLADLELPAEVEAFVVNESGRILAHRSAAEVLSGRIFENPSASGARSLADGRDGLVASRLLTAVDETAYVIITRPLETALANAIEIRNATVTAAFLLLLVGSVLALGQSAAIVRPVESLARAARRISDGDLDANIEVSGPTEINALAQTFQEMTERLKRTIADLARSEFTERQRAMVTLESIGDAVITTDPEGTVTYLNPVAESLTGWSLEEAQGQAISQVFRIVNEDTRADAPDPVAQCLESGNIVGLANHTALIGRNGQEYPISDSAAPIREASGAIIGVVLVFSDGTERRAIEQALRQSQKMEAIGQLSGGIAHDFNNLMQVIQGNAELLNEDPDRDTDLTAPILRATKRGAELTNRLLAFARKQPLSSRPTDVANLLEDILPMLDRTLGEQIQVTLELEAELWTAKVDPGQLETALLNLSLNARDAMPDGGRLEIKCANAPRKEFTNGAEADISETEFVRISVSDNGIGMSAETREMAIDPFYTTKGVGEGSGLGLSMVYGFAVQSGGHLEIKSAMGEGTTMSIFLPRSKEPVPIDLGGKSGKPEIGRGETILVLEDDPAVRTLVRKTIEGLGYLVVDVANLADARKALDEHRDVSLVLSDVVLSGGENGLKFAREIKETRPELPVALMSGYPDTQAADKDINAQGFPLLSKPFQQSELASTLRALLD